MVLSGIASEVLNGSIKGASLSQDYSAFPEEYSAQRIIEFADIKIYPEEYFCPKWMSDHGMKGPEPKAITSNTRTIHWCNSSWKDNRFLELLNKIIQNIKI